MPKYSINHEAELELEGLAFDATYQFYDTITLGEELLRVDPTEKNPEAVSYCVSRASAKAGVLLIGLELHSNVAVIAKCKEEMIFYNAGSASAESNGYKKFLKYVLALEEKPEIYIIEKPAPMQNRECAITLAVELSKSLDREIKRLSVPNYHYLCADALNGMVVLSNKIEVAEPDVDYQPSHGRVIDTSQAIPIKTTLVDLAVLQKAKKYQTTLFTQAFWNRYQQPERCTHQVLLSSSSPSMLT